MCPGAPPRLEDGISDIGTTPSGCSLPNFLSEGLTPEPKKQAAKETPEKPTQDEGEKSEAKLPTFLTAPATKNKQAKRLMAKAKGKAKGKAKAKAKAASSKIPVQKKPAKDVEHPNWAYDKPIAVPRGALRKNT